MPLTCFLTGGLWHFVTASHRKANKITTLDWYICLFTILKYTLTHTNTWIVWAFFCVFVLLFCPEHKFHSFSRLKVLVLLHSAGLLVHNTHHDLHLESVVMKKSAHSNAAVTVWKRIHTSLLITASRQSAGHSPGHLYPGSLMLLCLISTDHLYIASHWFQWFSTFSCAAWVRGWYIGVVHVCGTMSYILIICIHSPCMRHYLPPLYILTHPFLFLFSFFHRPSGSSFHGFCWRRLAHYRGRSSKRTLPDFFYHSMNRSRETTFFLHAVRFKTAWHLKCSHRGFTDGGLVNVFAEGKKREDERDQLCYDPVWYLFVLML